MMRDGELDPAGLALVEAARAAAANTYSPYFPFPVGAALRLSSGEVVQGTNVQTASLEAGVCAERSALVAARSRYGAAMEVDALAVVATVPGVRSCPPCGTCRTMINELMPPGARVTFLLDGGWRTIAVAELLPYAFAIDAGSSPG